MVQGYICVAFTLAFTVYGQIVLKWQLSNITLPASVLDKATSLFQLMIRPGFFPDLFRLLLHRCFGWRP